MNAEEMRRVWQERSEEAFAEVTQWREAHPKATLAEIEAVIDSKIMALRAAMIQDTALTSSARAPSTSSTALACEQCGHPLQGRGQRKRILHAQGGQDVTLQREYFTCSQCGNGLFPPRRPITASPCLSVTSCVSSPCTLRNTAPLCSCD